ncbi:hypothetical protein HUT19_16655 [Streptomyces sp. NA02950]|uniref:hypothetical protein n=1 Tax=Streptomyces sp. NA02950 TaxID=2742137 RepID=UPI00158FFDDA|nr:hypothetical protein [Streptomyces sp. NA02950]QKV93184.1 hypothetical protein HUT19_16655 [Streptomyces sp. NA02950]
MITSAAPAVPTARPGRGLAAGIAAGLLGALVFGEAQGKIGHGGQEVGYWALATGLLIGAALGGLGGRAPLLALIGIPLALVSVFFAQLVGIAVQIGDDSSWGTADTLIDHFGLVADHWRGEVLSRNDIMFYAVAGAESYLVAKRITE